MTGAMKLWGGAPAKAGRAIQEINQGQKQSIRSKRPDTNHHMLAATPRLPATCPKHAEDAPASPQAPHHRHDLQEQRQRKKIGQTHHPCKTPDIETQTRNSHVRNRNGQSTCRARSQTPSRSVGVRYPSDKTWIIWTPLGWPREEAHRRGQLYACRYTIIAGKTPDPTEAGRGGGVQEEQEGGSGQAHRSWSKRT